MKNMDAAFEISNRHEPSRTEKGKPAPEVQALSIEHFILNSILMLNEQAFGSDVAIYASKAAEKRITDGAFYGAVNHLRSKEFIRTTKKGVRSMHSITEAGLLALRKAENKITSSQQFFCTG